MVLSDTEMRKRMMARSLVIEPYPVDDAIQPSSIDLHLANEVMKVSHQHWVINPREDIWYNKKKLDADDPRGFALESRQFVLSSTREWIEVPDDLVARIEGKSSLGRIGLVVHVTAGFIDPGYRGRITLELTNLNSIPILLFPGMKIAQICFMPMIGKVSRPYGSDGLGSRYQDSKGTVGYKPPSNRLDQSQTHRSLQGRQ